MRITATHFWTALMAAVLSIFSLKFLRVFKFIDWSPVGWSERLHIFTTTPGWFKWTLLGIVCFVLFFLLYMITLFTSKIPPSVSSLIITIIALIFIEWAIYVNAELTMKQFLKKLSIPFACLLAMVIRFVIGTSVYMRKTF
ncbi:hypothetical protein [Sporosarcina aquimarina]|uniref:hypothetical protein n=1 Tax=Sporosarcina aquimarina TaxID=114975 RepID=UPI001C8DFE10|nr:hypothetical protein [Sporosarcina aquimarina]MBY0220891.1 hypothetical protein [Sporosarcina aquimarina]